MSQTSSPFSQTLSRRQPPPPALLAAVRRSVRLLQRPRTLQGEPGQSRRRLLTDSVPVCAASAPLTTAIKTSQSQPIVPAARLQAPQFSADGPDRFTSARWSSFSSVYLGSPSSRGCGASLTRSTEHGPRVPPPRELGSGRRRGIRQLFRPGKGLRGVGSPASRERPGEQRAHRQPRSARRGGVCERNYMLDMNV